MKVNPHNFKLVSSIIVLCASTFLTVVSLFEGVKFHNTVLIIVGICSIITAYLGYRGIISIDND